MRKLYGIVGLGLFSVTLGCQHVGGKCDQCGATPGDASLYAPLTGYQTPTTPTPIPRPAVSSESTDTPKKELPKPMAEELGAPKEMPKK